MRLVVLLAAGDRAPAHPGERPDLRHRGTGQGGGRHDEGRVDLGVGHRDQRQQSEAAEHRLHQHHGSLADAVGEAAGDGGAHGIRDGKGAGGGTPGAVRAGGAGDEQEGAHLGHRQRQPADERDGDVERAGEGEQPAVGGKG